MTDSAETTRVWLVERDYDDRDLITLVYATPAGDRALRKEQAASTIARGSAITAAREVEADRLEPVTDEETRARYADEAARVAANNDPDDPV